MWVAGGGIALRKLCYCNACMVKLALDSLILILAFMGVLAFGISAAAAAASGIRSHQSVFTNASNGTLLMRKLLFSPGDGEMDRVGSTRCSRDNIVIFQGPTDPLPSGIPTYTVQIINVCISGCTVSDVHVSCGWFSSARLVNPNVFRRVDYDDCLVNNGDPLGPGQSLSFQYANSFSYPLSISSLECC